MYYVNTLFSYRAEIIFVMFMLFAYPSGALVAVHFMDDNQNYQAAYCRGSWWHILYG